MLFSHPKDVGRIVEAEGSREVKSSQQCLDQDFTPVCTTEIGACQVLAKDFQRRGVERSRDKSPQMLLRTRLTQCLRVPVPVMLWFREVQLIGLSCDSVEQHRKWAEVEGCQFFGDFLACGCSSPAGCPRGLEADRQGLTAGLPHHRG